MGPHFSPGRNVLILMAASALAASALAACATLPSPQAARTAKPAQAYATAQAFAGPAREWPADDWWRAHPFSLSAAPNGRYLRFTVKALGDFSARLQALPCGVRVAIEGPYGNLTGAVRTRRRVLLVGGGIGVTPLRALLEALPYEPGDLTLLFRASGERDLVFEAEIESIARRRGAVVHYLVGPRGRRPASDPLGPASIRRLVPDVAERDVYLCGPVPLMDMVGRGLRSLGVPDVRIHAERFHQ